MSSRRKILNVSPEFLTALFQMDGTRAVRFEGMPDDARIVAVSDQHKFGLGWFSFLVESDTFPEVKDGNCYDEMCVTCTRVDGPLPEEADQYTVLIHGRGP